jgi:hypothetical protein
VGLKSGTSELRSQVVVSGVEHQELVVQVELVVQAGQVVVAQEGTSEGVNGSKWFIRSKWIKQCRSSNTELVVCGSSS